MKSLDLLGKEAKEASKVLSLLSTNDKNELLKNAAISIQKNSDFILTENMKDVEKAKSSGISEVLIDRLMLNKNRIQASSDGLLEISRLKDPIGEFISMKSLPQGITVGQKRVPFGVIGIIYESRPNVTIDAFGLCFKAGSALILRGGKEAINSNCALVKILQEVLINQGLPQSIVSLIMDTSHEVANDFMRLKYLDVLIPRGGANLIKSVKENATVPIIETGVGNCHIYVDDSADFEMAERIIINAKTQRPGVCNACEKLLIHKAVAKDFLPVIGNSLKEHGVKIVGDDFVVNKLPWANVADESDWYTEFLDLIIGIKIVSDLNVAIDHINKYSSGHSECIVTNSYENSQIFLNQVDSAAVYVNASTRFTDGFEFGFGAEIGISTQKLHARGPMGLTELTTTKYVILGNGQIRE